MQKKIYKNLLTSLEASNYKNRSQELCCFTAQKGSDYNNKLMIVGRAVNDWSSEFRLNDVQINELLHELFLNSPEHNCPLQWVESSWGSVKEYNAKKSAFWRVVKNLSLNINQLESDSSWVSKIVWSNLYKIAPSGGGNPSDSLCDAQFEACNELLKAEIIEFKPKYIVFLTGEDWFNGFLSENVELKTVDGLKWVDAYGVIKLDNIVSKVVIAKHPQGKPESELFNEIINALE